MKILTRVSPVEKERSRCIKKFLYYFKEGYKDEKYIDWERSYKWNAHEKFQESLNEKDYLKMLKAKEYDKIANLAVKIESKTNLLFSFEKMALRDAIKTGDGAEKFAKGLFDYLYGKKSLQQRFENFTDVVSGLPRKQTRVLTWPLVTVFGFIGNPKEHMFLKPTVTRIAAKKYAFDFKYTSRPNWETYRSLLEFANLVCKDTRIYNPRDFIDVQSFIWVQGSEEYPG